MDGKISAGINADLALTGASILTKLLGIVVPQAKALEIVIGVIGDRRNKKHRDRADKLFQSFGRRLTQLECKPLESPDIDLFDEIVAKAVSDEDEDKTELYAALVQYWIEHQSELAPYEVRLLGNAIKGLTVDEIKAFHEYHINKGPYPTKNIPEQLQEVFWNRVKFLGLLGYIGHFESGLVFHSQPNGCDPSRITKIGRMLVEIYQLSITTKS